MPAEDEFYMHLTEEREINDLLFITDVLITDYSSVIFEYALLNRRTIFFVPDLEAYMESRDFFYEFDKYTYGEVTRNMDELLDAIENGKIDQKKLKAFKDYFISSCDGNSTERFVKQFFLKENSCEKNRN
jgi:CDP-ribitol ribitolphosphotransferase